MLQRKSSTLSDNMCCTITSGRKHRAILDTWLSQHIPAFPLDVQGHSECDNKLLRYDNVETFS